MLSAPKPATVVVSALLVGVALISLKVHIPVLAGIVGQHRVAIVTAGYAVLLVGVLIRRA